MKEKIIQLNPMGQYINQSKDRYDVIETDKEIDYNDVGAFRLAAAVIEHCFRDKTKTINKDKFVTRNFAINSKLLKLFADCSDNFEEGKLRKHILQKTK